MPQSRLIPPGSTDPAWKYGTLKDKNNYSVVICDLCSKEIRGGGVNRLKQHLAHIKGNTQACPGVDNAIKQEIRQYMEEIQKKKTDKSKVVASVGEEVDLAMAKEKEIDDSHLNTIPSSDSSMRQVGIQETIDKKQRDRVNQYIARWVYRSGISFNAVCNNAFLSMCQAIGQYGKNLKPPSYYEVSESLLKVEVENTRNDLQPHREMWRRYGCTIMTDAWSDRRSRSLMNLLVNCELGTCFLKAIDAYAESHTGEYIMSFIDGCIQEVGQENVLQIVTDNASANVLAGRMLEDEYPHIFWTSCVAHVIDLILEEFGKEKRIKTTITKAKELIGFIYSHTKTLSLMHKFTEKGEILRPGVTMFATSFLTLQSLLDKKDKLRLMFISAEWNQCKWSKTRPGAKATTTILAPTFWNQVSSAIKLCTPLIYLLRIVDGDKKPSMGFVYGELEDAKQEIKTLFKGVEASFRPFINAITIKTKDRLDNPLHKASYFLNPYYFYKNQDEIEKQPDLMDGLIKCIETFFTDVDIQDKITRTKLGFYMMKLGSFGKALAMRQCLINDDEYKPAMWWRLHGGAAPHLQEMAIKILSLTSSSYGCERNWSTFEGIHTKKRNKLEVKRLNDLVYVQFNAKLQEQRERKAKDPLLTSDRTHAMEWMGDATTENDEAPDNDGLTWGNVASAAGVDDVLQARATRSQTRATTHLATSTSMSQIDEEDLAEDPSSDDDDDVEPVFAEFEDEDGYLD